MGCALTCGVSGVLSAVTISIPVQFSSAVTISTSSVQPGRFRDERKIRQHWAPLTASKTMDVAASTIQQLQDCRQFDEARRRLEKWGWTLTVVNDNGRKRWTYDPPSSGSYSAVLRKGGLRTLPDVVTYLQRGSTSQARPKRQRVASRRSGRDAGRR